MSVYSIATNTIHPTISGHRKIIQSDSPEAICEKLFGPPPPLSYLGKLALIEKSVTARNHNLSRKLALSQILKDDDAES